MHDQNKLLKFRKQTDLIYLGTNLCCTTIPHIKILLDLGIKADIDLIGSFDDFKNLKFRDEIRFRDLLIYHLKELFKKRVLFL